MDEHVSLITTIFSDDDEVKIVRNLSGDGVQAFIDIVDKASPLALLPPMRLPPLKLPQSVG